MRDALPVLNRTKLVGDPAHVRNALHTAYRTGRLAQVHGAELTPSGTMVADVTFRETFPPATYGRHGNRPQTAVRRPKRPYLLAGGAGLLLALVVGLAYLVAVAVTWVAAHLAVVLGALVGLVLLLVLAHGPVSAAGCCPCHRR